MSTAERLGTFLSTTDVNDLPPQALEHASMVIASTVASAAYGSGIDSAMIIRALARERGGRPDATLWFDTGAQLPVADAAQANAVMSDAAASDDSDLRNIIHPGTTITAAALAMAQRTGASGEAVLGAIVLGYEAVGRIGEAVTPGFLDRGFHGCVCAIFGAAVASGRLLELDAPAMTQAIALAATSIGGLMNAANTSTAREYHAGLATLLGTNAALIAQRGFQAETTILEGPKGYFETIGGIEGAKGAAIATRDLGTSWDIITDMAIKLMPGGHPFHATGEAAANAARAGNIAPDDVEAIEIYRPSLSAFVNGPLHPDDLISMAHSPAYFAAAGVADREFTWIHASPEKISDPLIHRLIDTVRAGARPPTADDARYRQGASVTIHTRDGRVTTSTVYVPKGAGELGISWTDVDAKYRALVPAAGLADRNLEDALGLIHDFRHLKDVGTLLELLRVGSA